MEHEHKWEYKETISTSEKFNSVIYEPVQKAIFVCKCGEVIKRDVKQDNQGELKK